LREELKGKGGLIVSQSQSASVTYQLRMALRSLGRYDCKYSGIILDIRLGNLSIAFSSRRNKAFVLYPKINLISSIMFMISNWYNDRWVDMTVSTVE